MCHSIANGIEPGIDSKKTDKHATEIPKAVCKGVKCSMCDVAKGIHLLDKEHFLFKQEKIHASKSF